MLNSEHSTGYNGHHRAGFSMIELLVVIVITGVLVGIAVPALGRAQARRRVVNARDSFVWLASRARMAAVERGTIARLELDPGTGQAQVLLRLSNGADSVLEVVRYGEEYGVSVSTESGEDTKICYDSRGYAMGSSCTMDGLPEVLVFTNTGSDTARARILLLGQVERR